MDVEILGVAIVASFVVMKLIEAIITPLWLRLGWDRFYLIYVSLLIGGGLAWYTGLNALPVFVVEPVVGRVLTCLAVGLGPSFLYDLTDK